MNAHKGDIIQETGGGIALITGHIAIVEGTFYDAGQSQLYIRLIEVGISGVVYGVLDDTRYQHRSIAIHRVASASTSQKNGAINFCISQLGKPYNPVVFAVNPNEPILPGSLGQCSTGNASCWYCSELVWAAYYGEGINLYGFTIPDNIYYPSLLAASSKLSLIAKY